MNPQVMNEVESFDFNQISQERRNELAALIDYIQTRRAEQQLVLLNFICTHNSRRSQFAQVWAQVAADFYQIPAHSFSGGVEVTACNERTIASLRRFGFEINSFGQENPKYQVKWHSQQREIVLYSKLFDDAANPDKGFAAVMTCSHADENCPFVPGCEKRISLPYEDPGSFDGQENESEMYDRRSKEIATEIFYAFSKIQQS